MLIALAQLGQQALRETDIFARWGGEEFMVLTPQCKAADAVQIAEKLRNRVESHEFPGVGRVTVSIGVAELLIRESVDSLFKRVDDALYEAKAFGRNTTRLSQS